VIGGACKAQHTTVTLVDDLDQGDADETVESGVDGATFENDLLDTNAAKLRDALADYVRTPIASAGADRPAARQRVRSA
jgi:hypothetical protein